LKWRARHRAGLDGHIYGTPPRDTTPSTALATSLCLGALTIPCFTSVAVLACDFYVWFTTATIQKPSMTDSFSENAVDLTSTVLQEVLEDVHTRFILNLPATEFQTADRILFQVEQAWWYYDDFFCDKNPDLPRFSTFKPFAKMMFDYSVLLNANKFNEMWTEFGNYKRGIANYGCILLNSDCTKLILCKVWNSQTFMLPAGKINQGEDGGDAAARETYEETGFDPSCNSGLTAQWKESNPSLITWNREMLDSHLLVSVDRTGKGKQRNCYVVVGVPEDFPFNPIARKEVASVEWHPIDQLPKQHFAVLPFITMLKKWLKKNQHQQQQQQQQRKQTPKQPRKRTPKKGRAGSRDNTPAKGQQQQQQQQSVVTPTANPKQLLTKRGGPNAASPEFVKETTYPPRYREVIVNDAANNDDSTITTAWTEDERFVQQWLANLPRPHTTKHFGTFRLDADEIWNQAMTAITGKSQ
jgi:8-oxo-dGTP pyrophosphatase MutT (NUDIX family)